MSRPRNFDALRAQLRVPTTRAVDVRRGRSEAKLAAANLELAEPLPRRRSRSVGDQAKKRVRIASDATPDVSPIKHRLRSQGSAQPVEYEDEEGEAQQATSFAQFDELLRHRRKRSKSAVRSGEEVTNNQALDYSEVTEQLQNLDIKDESVYDDACENITRNIDTRRRG
jgi:hypothetical protein